MKSLLVRTEGVLTTTSLEPSRQAPEDTSTNNYKQSPKTHLRNIAV
jgi:hypothetical protein